MGNLALPKPLRLGHVQARELLDMALDLLGALAALLWFHRKQAVPRQSSSKLGSALGLHCFSRLELSREPQCKPNAEGKFTCTILRRSLRSLKSKPELGFPMASQEVDHLKLAEREFKTRDKPTTMIRTEDYIWVDVRSPAEYRQGHVPGAFNLPLFNNEERAEVGTIYAKSGKNAAIERGLEIVGPRLSRMLRQGKALGQKGKLMLYCWRGGMRSASVAWLLRLENVELEVYPGGYKAYRRSFFDLLEAGWRFVVLGGPTLCGKTEILKELSRQGEQILDLEGMARHKGSAFGGLGQGEQPNNEEFSNFLHLALEKLDPKRPVWCEGESLNMGKVVMPKEFFGLIDAAPMVYVEIPQAKRIQRGLQEYGTMPPELLVNCFEKIQRRIGLDVARKGIEAIQKGRLPEAVALAMDYYDKSYRYSLQKRKGPVLFRYEKDAPIPVMAEEIRVQMQNYQ